MIESPVISFIGWGGEGGKVSGNEYYKSRF